VIEETELLRESLGVELEEERKEVLRRALIITVGTSASIHIFSRLMFMYPEIILNNTLCITETSKDMIDEAINVIAEGYKKIYSARRGVSERIYAGRFPVTTLISKLKSDKFAFAEYGGANIPHHGLELYLRKRSEFIEHVRNIVERDNCKVAIILGCAGKGSATLQAPAITADLMKECLETPGMPVPIAFITLPFRANRAGTINAQHTLKFLAKPEAYENLIKVPVETPIPTVLIDYERALDAYFYLTKEKPKRITMNAVFARAVDAMNIVLSTFLKALNYPRLCSPPIDPSDLLSLISMKGKVGVLNYTMRDNIDELMAKHSHDLDVLVSMRTDPMPTEVNVLTVFMAKEVPLEAMDALDAYYTAKGAKNFLFIGLNKDAKAIIASLMYGFDPLAISPSMTPKAYRWTERIKRALKFW